MSRFIKFVKTTALGGLLVVVPIAIVVFVLGQLLLALFSLARESMNWLHMDADDALIISGVDDTHQFAPIEVDLYNWEARALGLLVETLPGNRSAVFVPTAPVATVGNLFVISNDKVSRIEASMADTITVVTQWGVDAESLFRGEKKPGPDDASAGG